MKINKIKGFNPFGNEDPDVATFGGFLNSILRHGGGHHQPPNPPNNGALEFRTIDGTGNNETNALLNSAGTNFARTTPAHFQDDGRTPFVNDISTRFISDTVVGQGEAAVPNPQGLSGMMHAWGQFIDHDLDLIRGGNAADPANAMTIVHGDVTIPFTRSAIADGTGTDNDTNPAAAVNRITGWLDASMIYGSDAATAANLRLADGHMKTSEGGNLPTDPVSGRFQAGDVRAQENPALTSLQALFVREHNFQVDRLAELHPDWTGDQLYENARAVVGAEIANITYNEFLKHLLGPNWIGRYKGYDEDVDPTISAEFAGAAYRFGHSMVSDSVDKLDENGNVLATQTLAESFFETAPGFAANGGADSVLRFLAADHSMAMDGRIINDLRNFLADGPGRIDLAAINMQRGRDLGLGTLNETREALGLNPYTDIDQITKDSGTRQALKDAYGEDGVDQIDLWVGGLAERHAKGAMIGETFTKIIGDQFEALRDGDRLWFENQGFDRATLKEIKSTSLADIIERNTDIQNIQDDVFVHYDRHSGALGGIAGENPNAPQLVVGSDGIDTLVGGAKGDMLVAAAGGLQTMTGKQGNDLFMFGQDMNAKITDFKPGKDKIVFEDAGELDSFRDLSITSQGRNTVIEGNGNHIVLTDVRAYQLRPQDFVFDNN
jgi:peroxidase